MPFRRSSETHRLTTILGWPLRGISKSRRPKRRKHSLPTAPHCGKNCIWRLAKPWKWKAPGR